MTLSVQATFATETPAKIPEQIGLRGLLAEASLSDMCPYNGSGYDSIGLAGAPARQIARPEITTPKKVYPVESYYLNGAQYLTGGVGNRLSFH